MEVKAPILIIDLEATCWESKELHPGENEIIEIGAVLIDSSRQIRWSGGFFVRPVLNPVLSDFCTKLTSISQADVDSAPSLAVALERFSEQVKSSLSCTLKDCTFVSWGNYDRNQFEKDCARHDIPYPFGPHMNLKAEFLKKHNLKHAGVPSALKTLGLSFEGTHHRGVDDALNIARIFLDDFAG